MIISTEAEEAFVKIIKPFMIFKNLIKLGITKAYKNTANIYLMLKH